LVEGTPFKSKGIWDGVWEISWTLAAVKCLKQIPKLLNCN
jgi:hypothetical protein